MEYYAHKREDGRFQTIVEHLNHVALLSSSYSISELEKTCYSAGILHDAGKYLHDFQKRIRGNTSIQVEHSIIGAKILNEKYANTPEIVLLEAIIAGHHSGIPDLGLPSDTADDITLSGRIQRNVNDYSEFFSDVDISTLQFSQNDFKNYLISGCQNADDIIEKYAFLTRYVFSCLTDADSIDTAEFISGEKMECLRADFISCLQKIDDRFSHFIPKTELQKARSEIQSQVYEKVGAEENFFLLNMPTGSGKTLCSTKFALKRAIQNGKKRIIYVIPYNSIIDQTYYELKSIFGESAEILRHQSTFSYMDEDIEEDYRSRSLSACENWDAQIIVTTSVQFFESVYDNKRKMLRKLHNYSDSVIIFDEIHLMPVDRMQPCLRAVEYISSLLHSDIVFCTATMPDFRRLFEKYTSLNLPLIELAEDKSQFSMFDKCAYSNLGLLSDENIIEKAQKYPSSLVVVNTRRKAQELYHLATGKKYHLSTYMTPLDRMRVINAIKSELKQLENDYPDLENVPAKRRIIVISTSLIEAGVDLDFFCCFRELTGLDSILQTGGRCNREGKRQRGQVYVFITEDSANKPLKDIRMEIVKGIIEKYDDFSCAEAIEEYYNRLYCLNDEKIVSHSIVQMMGIKDIRRIPFASYDFSMIESHQISIFIPQDDSSRLLYEHIRETHSVNMRSIQQYCCSVSQSEFKKLLETGAIHNYDTDVFCLDNCDYYDFETGIVIENKDYFI